jgi:hypothetical protein
MKKDGSMANSLSHICHCWRSLALLIPLFVEFVDHITMKHQVIRLAYVDPGAGLLAFQILGASVMGGYYLLRRKLQLFFGWFKSKRSARDIHSTT